MARWLVGPFVVARLPWLTWNVHVFKFDKAQIIAKPLGALCDKIRQQTIVHLADGSVDFC